MKPKSELNWFFVITGVISFVIVPAVWLAILHGDSFWTFLSISLRFSCAVFLFLSLLLLTRLIRIPLILRILLTGIGLLYFLFYYLLLGYWSITNAPLDIFFVLDTLSDSIRFALFSLSIGQISLILSIFLLISIDFSFFAIGAYCLFDNFLKNYAPRKIWGGSILLFCVVLLFPSQTQLIRYFELNQTPRATVSIAMHAIIPNNEIYKIKNNGESVMILQLESQNALALEGLAVVDGKKYEGNFMPLETEIARDGVLFPMFWSNSVQTNRAQESLFCGIVNNLGRGLSISSDVIQTPCMPAIFDGAGYRTMVFRADKLSITGYEQFFDTLGFKEKYQKEILEKGDTISGTLGIDDCLFYKRIFEFLTKKYPDPSHGLFVYIEVTNNHYPFKERGYSQVHQFSPANNFVEQFLNSSLEQDYCLSKFYDSFKEYSKGEMHLLILPDNSWPIGIGGSTLNASGAHTEHFLIPMTYIPPTKRQKEFLVGQQSQQRCSQADFLPTVAELVSGTQYGNSCVPFMKYEKEQALMEAPYEDCHILTQPYGGGRVLVTRDNAVFSYALDSQELIRFDEQDLLMRKPQLIGYLSYDDFVRQYFCQRYLNHGSVGNDATEDN